MILFWMFWCGRLYWLTLWLVNGCMSCFNVTCLLEDVYDFNCMTYIRMQPIYEYTDARTTPMWLFSFTALSQGVYRCNPSTFNPDSLSPSQNYWSRMIRCNYLVIIIVTERDKSSWYQLQTYQSTFILTTIWYVIERSQNQIVRFYNLSKMAHPVSHFQLYRNITHDVFNI